MFLRSVDAGFLRPPSPISVCSEHYGPSERFRVIAPRTLFFFIHRDAGEALLDQIQYQNLSAL